MPTAIGRHKLVVLACALALAALGAASGASRKGTYTAAASLQVGRVNPNSPGFYGFVQSATDLAGAFSRAISAAPVLAAAHAKLGLSQRDAVARLSAEPIPGSPVFRVVATGPSASAATRLANVAAHAVIRYEARVNSYNPDTSRLLREYASASLELARATTKAREATQLYGSQTDSEARAHLERAQADRAAASLEVQALGNSYQLSRQSTTAGLVSLLAGATSASNDRGAKIQLLGFIGLLGGAVIGCALAVLIDRRGRLVGLRIDSWRR